MRGSQVKIIADNIIENINKVIIGKEEQIRLVVTALLAEGHVLLEDVPGSGKTMLAKTLAKSVHGEFRRIQFTPDLMPADITGMNYFNVKESQFEFIKGPVFTNILLADEINRATPKTQSGLLECMEEGQVTIDGVSYIMDSPFFVIATQNPLDTQGVFPLPEAQIDRFLIKLSLGYADIDSSVEILKRHVENNVYDNVKAVVNESELQEASDFVKQVKVHEDLLRYVAVITEKTRSLDGVLLGISHRGSIALVKFAKSLAAVSGRDYVIPDDIKAGVLPVFAHRLILRTNERLHKNAAEKILEELLANMPVPTEYERL